MRWSWIALLLLLGGCAAATGESGTVNLTFEARNQAGQPITEARAGETVQFVFRLENGSRTPVRFSYTWPPHRVLVRGPFGNTLWQAHEGMAFIQMMRDESLPAGSALEYSAEWQVPADVAGKLRVEPAFHAFIDGKPLEDKPETITLAVTR